MKEYVSRFRVATNGKEYRIEKNTDCGLMFSSLKWSPYPFGKDTYYFTDKPTANSKCRQLEAEDRRDWERVNLEWRGV